MIKSDTYITDEIRNAAEQEALATLMNTFTEKMFEKTMVKKKAGYRGWDSLSPETIESLKAKLADNINDGDWIDVANICMFLWNLKQPDPPVVTVTNTPTQ